VSQPAEYVTIRVRREVADRLDVLAQAWQCSRAGAVRRLLDQGASNVEVSHDRALVLLAAAAERGTASAIIAYAKQTEKMAASPPGEEDPLDAFRAA
jgi:predicted transcriptional regulator